MNSSCRWHSQLMQGSTADFPVHNQYVPAHAVSITGVSMESRVGEHECGAFGVKTAPVPNCTAQNVRRFQQILGDTVNSGLFITCTIQ